jgi:copper(I)-binding protein
MHRIKQIGILITLWILLASGCATPAQTLTIHEAWARPGEDGGNTAAYMRLVGGPQADQLLGVYTSIATRSELHQTTIDADGTAKMEHIDSIKIPANSEVELRPGDLHIMLMGLSEPLEVGDSLQLTLQCQEAGEVASEVPIHQP